MSNFLDALFSSDSCTVDGSMGRNPLTGAIEQIFDHMDVLQSTSNIPYPGHIYDPNYANNEDIIVQDGNYGYHADVPVYDDNTMNHMQNQSWASASTIDSYPHMMQPMMPYQHPMMPPQSMPFPMMNMMNMPMMMNQPHHHQQHQYDDQYHDYDQDIQQQSSSSYEQAEDYDTNIKAHITHQLGDAIYHGHGVSDDDMQQLMHHFEAQQHVEDDPAISREAYHASWQRTLDHLGTTSSSSQDYMFSDRNPYISQYDDIIATGSEAEKQAMYDRLYDEGMRYYHAGNISQAILSFEACVNDHHDDDVDVMHHHSDAWHMLGTCHSEHDDDKQAIICFQRSLSHDQYNISSLLALSICYVNELDSMRALQSIRAWVEHNPMFHDIHVDMDEYSDGTMMDEVVQLVQAVAALAPHDVDVMILLGVLYNVTLDYDHAQDSFTQALSSSSSSSYEYSIHNKIGATLANSNHSEEAISWYIKALKLRPGYARGWLNLGIAYSNLQQYEEAIRSYLQALTINPQAHHIWGYLRVSLTCLRRYDMIEHTTQRDIAALRQAFDK